MSEKGIKYLGSTVRGHYGDIASVKFDEVPEEILERTGDGDMRTRGAFKSFRIAKVKGELLVLVVDSFYEYCDPDELHPRFGDFDGDFDKKIELPNDPFCCYMQRNRVINAIKINENGLLERPSQEILDDLLSRQGSYSFSCGGYSIDDWDHNDSFDVYDGAGDLDDKPFVDTLTAEELGIEAINVPKKGMTLIVGGKAIRIRENGTVRDTKGNRYHNGELVMADKEKEPTALEDALAKKEAADRKYAEVLAKAKAKRKDVSGPGDNIGE